MPRVAVTVPTKDTSKPDGEAVAADGISLWDESEMVWPHSPSDVVDPNPIPVQKAQTSKKNTDNDDSDKAYRPPKQSNPLDDEAPEEIYDDDGEELEIEMEKGKEIVHTKGSTMLLS